MSIDLAVYELQEQVKELIKRVDLLEANRCLCSTCQTNDFYRREALVRKLTKGVPTA